MFPVFVALCLVAGIALAQYGTPTQDKPAAPAPPAADFQFVATYIEACSCDMFCPCYFNTHSTAHEKEHFCRANRVLRVD